MFDYNCEECSHFIIPFPVLPRCKFGCAGFRRQHQQQPVTRGADTEASHTLRSTLDCRDLRSTLDCRDQIQAVFRPNLDTLCVSTVLVWCGMHYHDDNRRLESQQLQSVSHPGFPPFPYIIGTVTLFLNVKLV